MMDRVACFLEGDAEGIVHCRLCPRCCAIASGSFGACGVRGNKNGTGIIPLYGYVTALAVDPIEKKPLYHFRPGSKILSAGFAGCNLRCPFCQNWRISQSTDAPGKKMSPADLVSSALHEGSQAIAYTYSEPLVHVEFLLDSMVLAHRHGIANVLVTNGCINEAAAQELLSLTDAANVDLKCFSGETYSKVLGGGSLETVLGFIRLAREKKLHIEITTLVVPGLNDTDEELDNCAGFIDSLGEGTGQPEVVWHLSAYRPDYRWNAPSTDPGLLTHIKKRAAGKLRYVYTGNVHGEKNDTACPGCGAILVQRSGYRVNHDGLAPAAAGEAFFRCARCGKRTAIHC